MTSHAPALVEPLVESAPLAHRVAPTLCATDPATGESCAWYHGVWQYWRVMGLAMTSGGQAAFMQETLRAMARGGDCPNVLVCGCADYSLPAQVLRAYGLESAGLRLTVLDRCETPLFLTRWYAERQRTAVATIRCHALDYANPGAFDVVVANSFLGYFDPPARRRLLEAWRDLLRPGGRLLLTNRIRPAAGDGLVGFGAEQARTFVEAARREAEQWRSVFAFDADEVGGWARAYAERFRSHPVRSIGEIESGLRETGFEPGHLEITVAPGRPEVARLSGPSTNEQADHARVLATRL